MTTQGKFRYPGITGVLQASYTMRRGITPGVAQVEIPPTTGLLPRGTMVWWYGGMYAQLPNCAVEAVRVTRPGGHTIWSVTIADRRWAWKFGAISGEYNVKAQNTIVPEREKTPQQLAAMCLDAMGETGYNVSLLPNEDRPYVNWKLTNPARELADLCELYGCIVCLRLDNTVRIERLGVGAPIPAGYLNADEEFDPSMTPPLLTFNSAPTRWQVDLTLEAVGKQTTGEIVPIGDLTYEPAATWGKSDTIDFSDIEDGATRKLAKEWIWKKYRVTLATPLSLDGIEDPITDLSRILPLIAEQVETEGEGEEKKSQKPFAWGKFYDHHGGGISNVETVGTDKPDTVPELIYEGNVRIDPETGIVDMGGQVYMLASDPEGRATAGRQAAELKIRCSVNLKHETSRALVRAEKTIAGDGTSHSPPLYLVRDDIEHLKYYDVDAAAWNDNIADVEASANYYLTEAYRTFIPQRSANADYAGFIYAHVDGALASVSWSIARDGKATSKVARNLEIGTDAPSYAERREFEKLRDSLKERDRERFYDKRKKKEGGNV